MTLHETVGELSSRYEFSVLEHLDTAFEVPVLSGLQAQGDLFIIPVNETADAGTAVPAHGIAVIPAIGSGHEHRLFAGTPGTATWMAARSAGAELGTVTCTEPAYLLHPEHGATGLAPGNYILRRQQEQAEVARLVAD